MWFCVACVYPLDCLCFVSRLHVGREREGLEKIKEGEIKKINNARNFLTHQTRTEKSQGKAAVCSGLVKVVSNNNLRIRQWQRAFKMKDLVFLFQKIYIT